MNDKLSELAENVKDEKSFLLFVKELVRDREKSANKEKANPSSPMVQILEVGKTLAKT